MSTLKYFYLKINYVITKSFLCHERIMRLPANRQYVKQNDKAEFNTYYNKGELCWLGIVSLSRGDQFIIQGFGEVWNSWTGKLFKAIVTPFVDARLFGESVDWLAVT